MKLSELEQIIREELEKELNERKSLSEKSVPEPYNRNSPPRRPMTRAQIRKRDKVGKAMLKNKDLVAKYKNKFEDGWKDYIWASATSKVLGRRKKND